jgi:predicted TIM-barrel fold metal-dependent hydrolase
MKLDAFCHVMPRPYFDRLSALTDTPAAANIRNRIEGIPSIVDLDVRFRQMDEFGEDYRQIVSLPAPPPEDLGPPEVSREMAALANDELAALVAAHPDRFAGWVAAVPMNDPEGAVAEVERAVGLGAAGGPLSQITAWPTWSPGRSSSSSMVTRPLTSAGCPTQASDATASSTSS